MGTLALAGCMTPVPTADRPENTVSGTQNVADNPTNERSRASRALVRYYARMQQDLLARGLLRTDGGGPDTPFDDETLIRDFERIAFYDEYERGKGLTSGRNTPGKLRRWESPVRVTVEFGASVPDAQRTKDRASITKYTQRLARITGHPISTGSNGNFRVLVVGEDDRPATIDRIQELVPNINPSALDIIDRLPRSIHCLVMAFSEDENENRYRQAIAIVRAEHPDLVRRSCFHEEMAQGLGLANDSPHARPSIFNDDDEFALLTTHDEMLLKMLYDPRLYAGISRDDAKPIFTMKARTLMGGSS